MSEGMATTGTSNPPNTLVNAVNTARTAVEDLDIARREKLETLQGLLAVTQSAPVMDAPLPDVGLIQQLMDCADLVREATASILRLDEMVRS